MSLQAIISRDPKLVLSEWRSCVAQNVALVEPTPRMIVNPFTRQPHEHHAAEGEVELWVDGEAVGLIAPSPEFSDDGELHLYTAHKNDNQMKAAVSAIAASLGAHLEWLDEED